MGLLASSQKISATHPISSCAWRHIISDSKLLMHILIGVTTSAAAAAAVTLGGISYVQAARCSVMSCPGRWLI